MSLALFWFRQDLRCHENPALQWACAKHTSLIPLYIKEPKPAVPMGSAQFWWLHHSLQALKQDLQKKGLDLYLKQDDPLSLLTKLVETKAIEAVYWNRCYEPAHIQRDQIIKTHLQALGIKVINCNSALLHEPWQVLNKSNEYFKVFTPYWRQAKSQIHLEPLLPIKQWPKLHPLSSDSLDSWDLLPKQPNWATEFSTRWQPGESGAWKKMDYFINTHLNHYARDRAIPSLSATSQLSPHLHFGEVSPKRLWLEVQRKMEDPQCNQESAVNFLSELGWREFSYQLLYHVPTLAEQPYKSSFAFFPWEDNDTLLTHWQKGQTGYPIVDAGMRELWRTGYMHNRVRMIVASFLTKDLFIHWSKGAAWFWDTLLDADLANNSANWQWVAGCGADAAPYFRIFNPTRQGELFDPEGVYVKKWVPELQAMPKKWLHQPWKAPQSYQRNYPLPIVNHDEARNKALGYYQQLKNEN